ncbi:MAG: hypothetical protein H6Q67_704 [Firmicutes bacterium]|nr:hypothetical protein [Bacillota bacterium]
MNTFPFSYQITYSSRRKTLQIKVVSPNKVEVTAPKGLSLDQIKHALKSKETWIIAQLAKAAQLTHNPINSQLADGFELLYLGQPQLLRIFYNSENKYAKVTLESRQIHVQVPFYPSEYPKKLDVLLRKWYRIKAKQYLTDKSAYWAEHIGVRFKRLSVRQQKTRWGSASSLGNINYNWLIIMAPPEVIDYLVIHELCHIKIPNHSAAFWQLVSQWDVDYKKHRKWLKQNGKLLTRLFD